MAPSKLLSCRRSALFFIPLTMLIAVCSGCGGGSNNGVETTPPPPTSNTNVWTWMGGTIAMDMVDNGSPGEQGTYGTQGISAAFNIPGGRRGSAIWKDKSGNVWLFGGYGIDANGKLVYLNDLWEFNSTTNQWTWVGGSNIGGTGDGQPGVYGTQGVSAATNVPGGRADASTWMDASGNLWLFGGIGLDSQGSSLGWLNDLWKFNLATKEWTWVTGCTTFGAGCSPGISGTQGVSSTTNTPGARQNASGWIDSSGNLWLFGGNGVDASSEGYSGILNDLWKFDPVAKTWTWISGSNTIDNPNGEPGIYGTQGVAASTNVPGSRDGAGAWTDSNGNFWLFGGYGTDSMAQTGELNDLWEFNPTSQQWVWVAGSNTMKTFPTSFAGGGEEYGQSGIYGTKGTPSAGNVPGGRDGLATWIDTSGNLWLFGGQGFDSTGSWGELNDLWKFNPDSKVWTWMSGSETQTQPTQQVYWTVPYTAGVYSTPGTPNSTNIPGSRTGAGAWTDSSGNLWLFGGWGADSNGTQGLLNDLWEYSP